MALMIVIAVPAFQSVTKSSAVGIGAGHLVNTLALARAQAVTTRSHVRVVFANDLNTNAIALSKQSFAVLQCTNQDDSSTVNWIYLDRWQLLPKGAYFNNLGSLPTSTGSTGVPFPTNGATVANGLATIEFNTAGAIASGGDLTFTVQEGMVLNGAPTATRAANTVTGVVYSATGRAKVIR